MNIQETMKFIFKLMSLIHNLCYQDFMMFKGYPFVLASLLFFEIISHYLAQAGHVMSALLPQPL